MKTLEQILNYEKEHRVEKGDFGINACKESIREEIARHEKWNLQNQTNKWNTSLYVLLEEYVRKSNGSIFFNSRMVLACWELINEQ